MADQMGEASDHAWPMARLVVQGASRWRGERWRVWRWKLVLVGPVWMSP